MTTDPHHAWTDTLARATTLLHTAENTLHSRTGQLHPREAAELLHAVEDLDHTLATIRGHALADLLDHTGQVGLTEEPRGEPELSWAGQLTAALGELFPPETAEAITTSAAFGALDYRLRQHHQDSGTGPRDTLAGLDPTARAFTTRADDPAAFLARKVTDL